MGDKVYELVISVDLSCCRCRKAIQDYLCQMQRKQCMRIVAIVYDEKNNAVLVSGPFDPEQLKRKLLCKLPKIINGIEIRKPPPPIKKPSSPENKCIKKCKKEGEEKCNKECENKCKCKCIKKCKKEGDEKCNKECDNKCKCKCKPKCTPKCKPKCKCNCEGRSPQVPIVCCARGVESWPGHGGHPQWSNFVSSQQSNIAFASAESYCSIM